MLLEDGWKKENFLALSKLIEENKNDKLKEFNSRNFIVTDWDNTAAIFDIEENVLAYQAMNFKYKFNSEEFKKIILMELDNQEIVKNRVLYEDTVNNFSLIESYIRKGLDYRNEKFYWDFQGQIAYIYRVYSSNFDYKTAAFRSLYLFKGHTEESLRNLAREAIDYWRNQSLQKRKFTFTLTDASTITCYLHLGLRPIAQMVNLFKTFRENGIDTYVCSASNQIIVEEIASSEIFGYGFNKSEVFGLNLLKDKDNRFVCQIDQSRPLTFLEGKVSYCKLLENQYKKPPLMFMGDSNGDYQALTYKGLKLALIIDLKRRGKIEDLKQMAKENKNDHIFLLQARDDNSGVFIEGDQSIEL